ncbi:unnamed protein product [Mycena citricolor]|uniref:Ricin B lectin domain-containing protein n=1 Tax=Mycena citricolor TaxID=2018698 RepID=A0AAD2HCU9_9AGAR|nr:unnamed protein product [Mycena citricolor]CAK5282499.1 unnamed protein product [Mycena citricolor]
MPRPLASTGIHIPLHLVSAMISSLSLLVSLSSLSLYAQAQLAGQTVQLQTILTASGNCLTAASNADGAPVTIESCSTPSAANSWVLPNGAHNSGPLQIYGNKCLDVINGAKADGTKLQIWTCAAENTNQKWVPAGEDSPIVWSGTNLCVDLTGGSTTAGNQLQVWSCDAQNSNQKWNHVAVTQPKTFSIALQHVQSQAFCIAATSAAANASVAIEACAGGAALQTWADPQNTGQMMLASTQGSALELCVQPMAFLSISPSPLVLAKCDASIASQGFNHQLEQPGIINSHAYGFNCIDNTNGKLVAGNQLQIWDCTSIRQSIDNTNQDWIVTNTF